MEKYIYNEQNGLWYELQGDYYIPCLALDEEYAHPIGMWGRKYLRYIKEHRPVLHTTLLLSGKLNSHLAEIDDRATEMFNRLIKQLAEKEGITEQLKAQDQMAWVSAMNNIRNRTEISFYGSRKPSPVMRKPITRHGIAPSAPTSIH